MGFETPKLAKVVDEVVNFVALSLATCSGAACAPGGGLAVDSSDQDDIWLREDKSLGRKSGVS